ncbi:hypothetical protein HDU97_008916 [Phlyctochytrium planicorne]|nr:hypothetical protein HDU97_008916 [Phlyctochytrium planicorne]
MEGGYSQAVALCETRQRYLPILLQNGFYINPAAFITVFKKRGNLDEVKLFLNHKELLIPPFESRVNAFHAALLTTAATEGYLHILKFLIEENGCDPNIVDREGQSSLHSAAKAGQVKVLEYLLLQGANMDLRDFYSQRPVEVALKNKEFQAVLFLIERGANVESTFMAYAGHGWDRNSFIHDCAVLGNVEIAQTLFEKLGNADHIVNAATQQGKTPLHLAALHGHYEMVVLLVEWGATVFPIDVNGKTPLAYAEERKHDAIVAFLMSKSLE